MIPFAGAIVLMGLWMVTVGTLHEESPDSTDSYDESHVWLIHNRGVVRVSHRAYGTVVDILGSASQKAQLAHNQAVQSVETQEIVADEMWLFVQKNKNVACMKN